MSNFEYLMHLNTCLSSSTLVAVADGRNLRADQLTLDMRLYGPSGEAIGIKSLQTAVSPWMIRVVTDQGQHDVTPNHLVTLRFAHDPEVRTELLHKDQADSTVTDAYCVVQWWDKRDLLLRQHRWSCAKLPPALDGREREFAAWWLDRAERVCEVFPLRRGDLFEVRADTLLTMQAKQDVFMRNVTIPMARLAHERVPSLPVAAPVSSSTPSSQGECPCMDADCGLFAPHNASPCDAIGADDDLAELAAAFLAETPAEADDAVMAATATFSDAAPPLYPRVVNAVTTGERDAEAAVTVQPDAANIQSIERVGADSYVAIEVDSADQRFVLSDFTVTHNCSGRSYNDINQYPVFPWIIAHYPEPKVKLVAGGSGSGSGSGGASSRGVEVVSEEGSESIDIEEVIRAGPGHKHTSRVFRDLSKPMGAVDPARLEQVLERFSSFFDSTIPPFHYVRTHSQAFVRAGWKRKRGDRLFRRCLKHSADARCCRADSLLCHSVVPLHPLFSQGSHYSNAAIVLF